jgi:fibronectin type 3 domain-containing protein
VPDTTPPTVPTWISVAKVAGTPTIRLTWNASTDNPPPAAPSGLAGYRIYRSADGVSFTLLTTHTNLATLAYDDSSAGWNTRWYYRITAYDNNSNESGPSAVLNAMTDPIPTYTLTVQNNSTPKNAYVWVQNATSGLWYNTSGVASATRYAGVYVAKKGGQALFNNLPAGVYRVYANFNGSGWVDGLPQFSGDLSAGPVTCVVTT